jgi:hypothetical protein
MDGDHSDSLRKPHRNSVMIDLGMTKILNHFEIEDVSEEDIDNALDQERPLGLPMPGRRRS